MVLKGRFRRQVRVRLPLDQLAGPMEIRCEHGAGRVPLLVAIVNLAILHNGGLALHASAFERDGTATIATGWSKGGKTEALLAHCRAGARYIGDEWLHLHPDGTVTGIDEPLRVWDWHLDQLPQARGHLGAGDRRRLALLRHADRAIDATGRSARLATLVRRQRFVDVDHPVIAPAGRVSGPVAIGRVFLMTSAQQAASTVVPISGAEVADRMAASLAFERAPLLAAVDAFRYAFPGADTAAVDDAPAVERARLHQFLDGADAAEVTHPYPVDLDDLGRAMGATREPAP